MDQTQFNLPPIVQRCKRLGLPVWTVRGAEVSAALEESAVGAAWMSAPSVLGCVREAAREWESRRETRVVRVGVGMWLAPVTCGGARLAVLTAGQSLLSSPLFARACAEVGLDDAQARTWMWPMARHDEASAASLRSTLQIYADDLSHADDARTTVEGFTAQLTDSYDTIEFLYSIGRAMRDPARPGEFVSLVCEHMQQTLSFEWIAATFLDDASPRLANELFVRGNAPKPMGAGLRNARRLINAATGAALIESVEGLSSAEHPQVVIQPLLRGGRVCGAILAGGKHGADPCVNSADLQLIEAAGGYISAFLHTVTLHDEQVALFVGTLQAITAAIDAKDRYTRGHSERVALVASQLARAVGRGAEECERVRIAGLVHDVGKIGVPERILTKSGRLSDEEFDAIRRHPVIGHTILKDIPQLEDVLPGVLHHHERWDGRGYPARLAGDEIPFIARLLAVADTFDAMSSTRSYRGAMSRETVLAEIARVSGTQFDPALVPAFLTLDFAEYDRLSAKHARAEMPLSEAA